MRFLEGWKISKKYRKQTPKKKKGSASSSKKVSLPKTGPTGIPNRTISTPSSVQKKVSVPKTGPTGIPNMSSSPKNFSSGNQKIHDAFITNPNNKKNVNSSSFNLTSFLSQSPATIQNYNKQVMQNKYGEAPKDNLHKFMDKTSLSMSKSFLNSSVAKAYEHFVPNKKDIKSSILDPYNTKLPSNFAKEGFDVVKSFFFGGNTKKELTDLAAVVMNKTIRIPYAMATQTVNNDIRTRAIEQEERQMVGLNKDESTMYCVDQKNGAVLVIRGKVQGDKYNIGDNTDGVTSTYISMRAFNKYKKDINHKNVFYVSGDVLGESKTGANDGIMRNSISYDANGVGYYSYSKIRNALKASSKKIDNSSMYYGMDYIGANTYIDTQNSRTISKNIKNKNASLSEEDKIPEHMTRNHNPGLAVGANALLPALTFLDLPRSTVKGFLDVDAEQRGGSYLSKGLSGSPMSLKLQREGKSTGTLDVWSKEYQNKKNYSELFKGFKIGAKQTRDNSFTTYFMERKPGEHDYVKHPFLYGLVLDTITDPLSYLDLAAAVTKSRAIKPVREVYNTELTKTLGKDLNAKAKVYSNVASKDNAVSYTLNRYVFGKHTSDKQASKILKGLNLDKFEEGTTRFMAKDSIDTVEKFSNIYNVTFSNRAKKQLINTLINPDIKDMPSAIRKILKNNGISESLTDSIMRSHDALTAYNSQQFFKSVGLSDKLTNSIVDSIISSNKTNKTLQAYKKANAIYKSNNTLYKHLNALDNKITLTAFGELTPAVFGTKTSLKYARKFKQSNLQEATEDVLKSVVDPSEGVLKQRVRSIKSLEHSVSNTMNGKRLSPSIANIRKFAHDEKIAYIGSAAKDVQEVTAKLKSTNSATLNFFTRSIHKSCEDLMNSFALSFKHTSDPSNDIQLLAMHDFVETLGVHTSDEAFRKLHNEIDVVLDNISNLDVLDEHAKEVEAYLLQQKQIVSEIEKSVNTASTAAFYRNLKSFVLDYRDFNNTPKTITYMESTPLKNASQTNAVRELLYNPKGFSYKNNMKDRNSLTSFLLNIQTDHPKAKFFSDKYRLTQSYIRKYLVNSNGEALSDIRLKSVLADLDEFAKADPKDLVHNADKYRNNPTINYILDMLSFDADKNTALSKYRQYLESALGNNLDNTESKVLREIANTEYIKRAENISNSWEGIYKLYAELNFGIHTDRVNRTLDLLESLHNSPTALADNTLNNIKDDLTVFSDAASDFCDYNKLFLDIDNIAKTYNQLDISAEQTLTEIKDVLDDFVNGHKGTTITNTEASSKALEQGDGAKDLSRALSKINKSESDPLYYSIDGQWEQNMTLGEYYNKHFSYDVNTLKRKHSRTPFDYDKHYNSDFSDYINALKRIDYEAQDSLEKATIKILEANDEKKATFATEKFDKVVQTKTNMLLQQRIIDEQYIVPMIVQNSNFQHTLNILEEAESILSKENVMHMLCTSATQINETLKGHTYIYALFDAIDNSTLPSEIKQTFKDNILNYQNTACTDFIESTTKYSVMKKLKDQLSYMFADSYEKLDNFVQSLAPATFSKNSKKLAEAGITPEEIAEISAHAHTADQDARMNYFKMYLEYPELWKDINSRIASGEKIVFFDTETLGLLKTTNTNSNRLVNIGAYVPEVLDENTTMQEVINSIFHRENGSISMVNPVTEKEFKAGVCPSDEALTSMFGHTDPSISRQEWHDLYVRDDALSEEDIIEPFDAEIKKRFPNTRSTDIQYYGFNTSSFDEPLLKRSDGAIGKYFKDKTFHDTYEAIKTEKGLCITDEDQATLDTLYNSFAQSMSNCQSTKLYDCTSSAIMYAHSKFCKLLDSELNTSAFDNIFGASVLSLYPRDSLKKYCLTSQETAFSLRDDLKATKKILYFPEFNNWKKTDAANALIHKITELLHPNASPEDIATYVSRIKDIDDFADSDVYKYWYVMAQANPDILKTGVPLSEVEVYKAQEATNGMPSNILRQLNGDPRAESKLYDMAQTIGTTNIITKESYTYFDIDTINNTPRYTRDATRRINRYTTAFPVHYAKEEATQLKIAQKTAFDELLKMLPQDDVLRKIIYPNDLATQHSVILCLVNRIDTIYKTNITKYAKQLKNISSDFDETLFNKIIEHDVSVKDDYFKYLDSMSVDNELTVSFMNYTFSDVLSEYRIPMNYKPSILSKYHDYFDELFFNTDEITKDNVFDNIKRLDATNKKTIQGRMTQIYQDSITRKHNLEMLSNDISSISNIGTSPSLNAVAVSEVPMNHLIEELIDCIDNDPERARTFVTELDDLMKHMRSDRTEETLTELTGKPELLPGFLINSENNGQMFLRMSDDATYKNFIDMCKAQPDTVIVTEFPNKSCTRIALKDSCFNIEDGIVFMNGVRVIPHTIARSSSYAEQLEASVTDKTFVGYLQQALKNLYRIAPDYLPDLTSGVLSFDDFYNVTKEFTYATGMYHIDDFAEQIRRTTLTANFIYSTTGELPDIKSLHVGNNPIRDLQNTIKSVTNNTLDARAGMAYYFNAQDLMSFKVLGDNFSDKDLLDVLNYNSDAMVCCAMVDDKASRRRLEKLNAMLDKAEASGNEKKVKRYTEEIQSYQEASIVRLEVNDLNDIKNAKRLNACLLPISAYENLAPKINNYKPLNPALQVWQKYVTLMKASYLTKLSTAFKNYVDESVKTINDVGFENLTAFERNKLIAAQSYVDYYTILNAMRKEMNSPNSIVHDLDSAYANSLNSGVLDKLNKFDIPEDDVSKYYNAIINSGAVRKDVIERMDYNTFMRLHGFQLYGASGGTLSSELQNRRLSQGIPEISKTAATGTRADVLKAFAKKSDKTLSDFGELGNYLFSSTVSMGLAPMASTEMVTRYAHMLTLEEMGMSDLEAFGRISKTHFNYDIKNRAAVYAQMVVPFYNFTKLNLDYWMRIFTENPHDLRYILRMNSALLRDSASDEYEKRGDDEYVDTTALTQYMSGSIPFFNVSGVPGQQAYLKVNPSFYDAFNFFTDPVNQGLNRIFTPLKTPLQSLPIFSAAVAQGIWDGNYGNSKTAWIPYLGTYWDTGVQQVDRMIDKTFSRNRDTAFANLLKLGDTSSMPVRLLKLISMQVPGFLAFDNPEYSSTLWDFLNANGYQYDYVTNKILPSEQCKARDTAELKQYLSKYDMEYDITTGQAVPRGIAYDKNREDNFYSWDTTRAIAQNYHNQDYDFVSGQWVAIGSKLPAIYGTTTPIFDYNEYKTWQTNRGYVYDYVRRTYVKKGSEIASSVLEAAEYERAHGKEWDYVLRKYVTEGTALASNYDEAKAYWKRTRGFIYDYARKCYVAPGQALAPDWNAYKTYQARKGLEYDYSTKTWVKQGTAKISDWRELYNFSKTWKTYSSNYVYYKYQKFDTWEEVQAFQRQRGKEWDPISKSWVKLGTAADWNQYQAYKRSKGLGWDAIHKQWVDLDKVPTWNQYQAYKESQGLEWDYIQKQWVAKGSAIGKSWTDYKNYGTLHNQTYDYTTQKWTGNYKSSASNKSGATKVFKNHPIKDYNVTGNSKYDYVESMIHKYIVSDFPNVRRNITTMPSLNMYQVGTRRVKKPVPKMRQAKYFSNNSKSFEKYYNSKS